MKIRSYNFADLENSKTAENVSHSFRTFDIFERFDNVEELIKSRILLISSFGSSLILSINIEQLFIPKFSVEGKYV